MKHEITLNVNGDSYSLAVNPWRTLNEVLREDLNLTGTKLGCGSGDCGACTVIVDNHSVSSCLTLAAEMDQKEIMTIEGLAPSGEELRLWKKEPSNVDFAHQEWNFPHII